MASSGMKSHPPKARKRVDVEEASGSLKRAADGSAFTRCDICNKDIAVAIADMHDCGSDLKTKARLQNPKPAEQPAKKNGGKKRERSSTDEQKPKKASKPNQAKKDPKMPKRPLTSFLLFMEDFRKTTKEENQTIKPAEMTKLGGERWKEMTDEEKAPYNEKAAKLKAEYEAQMKKYKGDDSKGEAKNEDGESATEADEVVFGF